ncbi:MAG: RNA polymerase sigma factor [Gaiellaceae bacterium]
MRDTWTTSTPIPRMGTRASWLRARGIRTWQSRDRRHKGSSGFAPERKTCILPRNRRAARTSSLKNGAKPLNQDDAELAARLKARDLEALGELYRRFGLAMRTLARSMLRNREQADDVCADSLVRILEAAPGFRGPRGLKTWVLRIVANRCRDAIRRRRFEGGSPDELDPLQHAGLRVSPEAEWDDAMDRAAMLAALERAIAALPVEQREAVILKERLELSVQETAEAMGISEGAVKSRLFRARLALLALLREWRP